jgi:ribosomal protein L37AE/L43A
MKIYESPKCQKKECENKAIALYAGMWVCGQCYEKIAIKLNDKRKADALEILE